MSDSDIEWLRDRFGRKGKTWNPTLGCKKKSPGCDGCYPIPIARVRSGNPNRKVQAAYEGLTIRTERGLDWSGKVNLLPQRLDQPIGWKRPCYIFVDSMSDLFYGPIPEEFIARVFAVMLVADWHVFIVLTKEHARMRALLNKTSFQDKVFEIAVEEYGLDPERGRDGWWPVPNLVLGVSTENQKWFDIRVPYLLDTPAAFRAVSAEPLIGPIRMDMCDWTPPHMDGFPGVHNPLSGEWWPAVGNGEEEAANRVIEQPRLDLVIVGGESGRTARAMHPDWARQIRDQVTGSEVCFFFKQWGEWGPAPFVVRVCDPKVGWTGTEEELAAAKADAEARGATHVHTNNGYREDRGEWVYHLHEIGHKPWSLERADEVTPPHEPMRRWGKANNPKTLDGQAWRQMPVEPRFTDRWTPKTYEHTA